MGMRRYRVILLVCALAAMPAAAAKQREQVVGINADNSINLAQTGKARFADILMPDSALAQAWLAQHLLQKPVAFTAGDTDRYGRTLITADVEEAMLRDGVAIIFNQQQIPSGWGAAEQSARGAKRGVWSTKDFLLSPEQRGDHFSEFHVVEGVVTHLYKGRSATYLNFGENWHTDFSVTIAGRNRRSFEDKLAHIHEGTHVRVRGAIYEENGPMIKLTRPEQLELN